MQGDSSRSVRTSFKEIYPISTGTGATCFAAFTLGVNTTSTLVPLGAAVPRMKTFGTIYRQFVLNRVSFRWIPCASTSSAGIVAMGVDQLVTAVSPTALQDVYRHVPSVMNDIKADGSIVWTNKAARTNDLKYTITQTGLDEDSMSYGVFQLYGTGPASTQVGIVEIVVDITFTGPY